MAAGLVCRLMSKYLSSDKNGTNEQNLSFYTSACEEDPELKSFDSSLDQRLSKLKRSLTTGGKTGNNSLNAVKSVCGFLVEVNQNLAENIIANKDLLKSEDLTSLVGLYHESSTSTLDLFNTVRNCTNKAKLSIVIIQIAIQQFGKESMDTEVGGNKKKYAETLEELNKVKAMGDPFGDEFKEKLESVRAEHLRASALEDYNKSSHSFPHKKILKYFNCVEPESREVAGKTRYHNCSAGPTPRGGPQLDDY